MGFKDPENAYKADVAGPVIHVMLQDPEIYKSIWYFERFRDNKPREFDVTQYDFTDEGTRNKLMSFLRKLEGIFYGLIFKDKKFGFRNYREAVSIMQMVIVDETPKIEEHNETKVTNLPN